MGTLFDEVTKQAVLKRAWRKIRSNGTRSSLPETKLAIDAFEQNSAGNIQILQSRLRARVREASKAKPFTFAPQTGVTKVKKSGGKRGLVLASIHNRIVERALLDVLQSNSKLVQEINNHPTSIGGVPKRSVPHGLKQIDSAFRSGKTHFVRSDIKAFFDKIPRDEVLSRVAKEISDQDFLQLLKEATEVTLKNAADLGEDRELFPTNSEGVAQGSPLSPLFGNILLGDFDLKMNGRGIICIRFIDDFLILGESATKVKAAFKSAERHLGELNLKCHDPFDGSRNKTKSDSGLVQQGFDFLGYYCEPGLFQPSKESRKKLLGTIDEHIRSARWSIKRVQKENSSFAHYQRYAQTLVLLDQVLRGWGQAFAYSTTSSTMDGLDLKIDQKLSDFRLWFSNQIKALDWKHRRRLGGVCLLQDIDFKTMDEVPFSLAKPKRVHASKYTTTVSIDGAVRSKGKRKTSDKGPGAWAFVDHSTNVSSTGFVKESTIIRMELTAFVEALKYVPEGRAIIVRTDSQYVVQVFNNESIVKSNHDLWREVETLSAARKVKVCWVKGHNGDVFNEKADSLAKRRLSDELKSS